MQKLIYCFTYALKRTTTDVGAIKIKDFKRRQFDKRSHIIPDEVVMAEVEQS